MVSKASIAEVTGVLRGNVSLVDHGVAESLMWGCNCNWSVDGSGGVVGWGGKVGNWGCWGCDDWGGIVGWGCGQDWSMGDCEWGLVDEGGSWVLWLNTGLVGLDVHSESSGIGNVVDNSETTIGISESVASDLAAVSGSRFSSEGTSGGVVLVVSESVVSDVVLVSVLSGGSSVDEGSMWSIKVSSIGHGGESEECEAGLHGWLG